MNPSILTHAARSETNPEPENITHLAELATIEASTAQDRKEKQAFLDKHYLRQRLSPDLEISEADAFRVFKAESDLRQTERIIDTSRGKAKELIPFVCQENEQIVERLREMFSANYEKCRAAAERQLAGFFPVNRLAVVVRYSSVCEQESVWQVSHAVPSPGTGATFVNDGKGGVMLEEYNIAGVVSTARQLRALLQETELHSEELAQRLRA